LASGSLSWTSISAVTGSTIALQPISEDEAVVAGIGNGEGWVVRASDIPGSHELVYSGFRFVRATADRNYSATAFSGEIPVLILVIIPFSSAIQLLRVLQERQFET